MAELQEENQVSGVFGGVSFENENNGNQNSSNNENVNYSQAGNIYGNNLQEKEAGTIRNTSSNLPTKRGLWSKFKSFWLQDIDWNAPIKVELTPHQQKIENEINEFLHQEITWKKVHDFLFQEINFGKKNK